ncbi:MAG: N-acetylmuramoyl-L-alanine amidase, partial [Clostridia bacterium]|nr:N-acetylmuramoyl-L-alanine amidase [Clostridia bacterium]
VEHFRQRGEEDVVRAPLPLDRDAERPLDGRVIVLDAGHGGEDSGALSPGSNIGLSEKDCNLNIVLAAEKEFSSLGAEVILLRDEDKTVDIYDRMDKINALCPDLVLSIHQNSMPSSTDITHIRGTVGLYWTESGRSLADCVAASVSAALGRPQRETASQRLAMVRNYKFPSALIEIGFLTSPEEFEVLTSPGGVERTAKAIVSGVLDWYDTQKP